MRAYHLRSTSESGEAPYGDHIVLARNYLPFGKYLGDTVFAAYSIGGVKYRWLTNHLLLIECETDKIIKQVDIFGDIHIQYKINVRPQRAGIDKGDVYDFMLYNERNMAPRNPTPNSSCL